MADPMRHLTPSREMSGPFEPIPDDPRDAEIARLREAVALAAIPLEAMLLAGTDKLHSDCTRLGIQEAVQAIRVALANPR